MIPTLETDRLVIRKLIVEDANDLKEWFGLDEVYKYWAWPPGKKQRNPELLFVESKPHARGMETNDFVWAIVLKACNKVIGVLEMYDIRDDNTAKAGYRINPRFWNRGYCTEALGTVIDFAVGKIGIKHMYVKIDCNNKASIRVALKCGFVLENTVVNGKMGLRRCDYQIMCH